ncbi:MAG: outer membrane protein transport protein [Vicinamibacterales bacterium]
MSTRAAVVILFIGFAFIPALAEGQGFGIYEQGACDMSRGGAGVAEPCDDGSAIYVNPAGVAGRKGVLVSGGATVVFGSGSFTPDQGTESKLDSALAAPPHGYLQYGLSDTLAVGVGLYAPYGLSIKWPLDFGGRFVSYDSSLKTFYIQPTVAYAINDGVSVGGGLTVAMSSVNLRRRQDLAAVPLGIVPGATFGLLLDNQTDFVDTSLSASGAKGLGANMGVIVKAHDRVRIGARYLTHVKLAYDGKSSFVPIAGSYRVTKANPLGLPVGTPLDSFVTQVVGALQDQDAGTELDMPAQLVVGLSVHANPSLKLFADYQWIGWSAFDTITLDFSQPIPADEPLVQNYRDTNAVRVGMEFQAARALRLSAGYFYNQAAAPDETVTPLLPEARRNHLTAGLGWNLHPSMTLDVAYQFVRHADRRGRIVNPPPGELPTVALNSGMYRLRADLLGITLTYRR